MDLTLFLGRFHPLLVHLPIGMLLAAAAMDLAGQRPDRMHLRQSAGFVLLAGAAGALLSAATGWLLAQSGEYDPDALDRHRWTGLATAFAASALWAWRRRAGAGSRLLLPAWGLLALLLVLSGHWGAALTHGEGYLTQHGPTWLSGSAPESEAPAGTDAYAVAVEPILRKSCFSCHNASKRKGGLRMDLRAELLKGGKHGPVWVAGDPEGSELYRRLTLPPEDEQHMPPEGRQPLSASDIRVIGWWISAGAPMELPLDSLEVPGEVRRILEQRLQGLPGGSARAAVLDLPVKPADPEALARLRARKAQMLPVEQGSNLLQLTLGRDSLPFGDAELALLLPLREQWLWLDLRGATAASFALLGQLPHLQRLNLAGTAVSDADLAALGGLAHLESLNLYGTAVTDAGIRHLRSLRSLRHLYLWQTQVSPAAADSLRAAIPGLKLSLGGAPL